MKRLILFLLCLNVAVCAQVDTGGLAIPGDAAVQVGPQMERALQSLSDAWREENRNRR